MREAEEVRLDEAIPQRVANLRTLFAQPRDDVIRESADPGAVLPDHELRRAIKPFPTFADLPGKRKPEIGARLGCGQEIAAAPRPASLGQVVAVFGVVERKFHEAGKGYLPVPLNLLFDNLDQYWIAADRRIVYNQ